MVSRGTVWSGGFYDFQFGMPLLERLGVSAADEQAPEAK